MKRRFYQKALAAIGGLLLLGVGSWAAVQESDTGEAKVGDVTYETLTEAITQANKGGNQTVTLLKDVTANQALSVTSPMTIDLNGHEISGTGTNLLDVNLADGGEVTIKGEGEDSKLTLDGGNSASTVQTVNLEKGTLNLQSGTITATKTATRGNVVAVNAGSEYDSQVTVKLIGANLVAQGGASARGITTPTVTDAVTEPILPKVIITGGNITATASSNGGAVGVYGNGNVNMSAGEIDVTGYNQVWGLYFPTYNHFQKTNIISGGTIKVTPVQNARNNFHDVMYGPALITGGNFYLYGDRTTNPIFTENYTRYYPITVVGGNFNKEVASRYISKEARLIDNGADVELRYTIERSKFNISVTGYNTDEIGEDDYREPVTVGASVFKDYTLAVYLPSTDETESGGYADEVGVDTTTVNVSMSGVTSLDFKSDETRSLTKDFNLGLYPQTYRISEKLPHAYAFGGATVPVKVIDDDAAATTKSFTYNLGAFKDNEIKGAADDETKAAEAWGIFAKHVEMSTDPDNANTHMLFKKGAYLQIGDERLVFLKDFDFLANNATIDHLFDGAQVQIQKVNVTGANTVKSVVYLPVGSTLGMGHTSAVINDDVTFTTDGSENAGSLTVTNFFTTQKSALNASEAKKSLAINTLLQFFDGIIGYVDEPGVNFTVQFSKTKGTPKFHLDVTGYDYDDPTKEIPVNADVYGDYSFDVALPDPLNDNLTASKATVNVSMTGVQSLGLGIDETRSFSKTVNTGVEAQAPLSQFLGNAYAFKGAVCPVTIKADGLTKQFRYNIANITNDYHIVGTPETTAGVAGTEGTQAAREAWQLMTSHVKTQSGVSPEDSHFLFKKGAYLQVGDERLVFLKDFDFLKGSASMADLFNGAQVKIQKVKAIDAETTKAEAYLPVGSTLGLSSSAASIDQDVYVRVLAKNDAATSELTTGFFTNLKSSATNARAAIGFAVVYFNQIVGLVDQLDGVSFEVEFQKPVTPKFHLDVTGYDPTTDYPVEVSADVYADYGFKVQLPDVDNDNLTASKATINISMTGVQSLGLKEGETRSYSKDVNTGVEGVTAKLSTSLKNTYAFNGATIPVIVKDETDSKSFEYQIAGINDEYQIIGTPVTADGTNGTEAARAAWKLLTSHVKTQSGVSPEDTHFLFKKGAFLQVGNERIVFLDDFDFLNGSASMATLFDGAKTRIEKVNKPADAKAVIYLPEGSTLGVSNSAAAIDEDVYVTVDGTENGVAAQNDFFSSLKSDKEVTAKAAIAGLVSYFDQVVGLVDQNGVSVTVEFKKNVEKTPKFHLDVTGYDAETNDPIAVNADVYGDYSFKVSLPDELNDNLSASKATLNVWMENVQSLGVTGKRSFSKTVETGVTGVSAKLSSTLTNTYKFNGLTCPVTIKDGAESHSFTYNIAAIDTLYQIIGTPDNEADARTAWQFMTNDNHLETKSGVIPEDSHFLFKAGSYIQIGDQRLVFTNDFDFLKGGVQQNASLADLFASAEVESKTANGAANDIAEVYLTSGSTLGLSSSAATVKKNVSIKMEGANLGGENVQNFFSGLKEGGNLDAKTAIAVLVKAFDEVVGAADAAEKVSFTVDFSDRNVFYKNVATDDWMEMSPDADGYYNIDGDALYAFRVDSDVADAKINFTRKFNSVNTFYAWNAPFDLVITPEIAANFKFSYIEGVNSKGDEDIDKDNPRQTIVLGVKSLQVGDVVEANKPYLIRALNSSVTGTPYTFTVENVTLTKTEPISTQITGNAYIYKSTGIYVSKTPSAEDNGWFALSNGTFSYQDGTVANTLKPFRFFLTITDNPDNPYAHHAISAKTMVMIVDEDGTVTGINGLKAEETTGQKIYDLQGRRVYKPTQKGIYIVNGRKVVLGK